MFLGGLAELLESEAWSWNEPARWMLSIQCRRRAFGNMPERSNSEVYYAISDILPYQNKHVTNLLFE
jgi:hypothetical protein